MADWRVRILVAAGALAAGVGAPAGQAPTAPRLHHLHLRVPDPAAAMSRLVRANDCVSVIVQSAGVGVRCGRMTLLFDRSDSTADPAPATPIVRAAVTVHGRGDRADVRTRIAVADRQSFSSWLRDHLGIAPPTTWTFVPLATSALPDEITHIAFGVADPAPLVARLRSAGVAVLSSTEDATTLVGPAGLTIEIVRDAGDGPDAYWCPMHPDTRSPAAGSCPRCGMALVAIPPPVFGDYRLRVDAAWTAPASGRLTLTLLDPVSRQPVTRLLTVHERLVHLFVVSRDLSFFEHVHPEPASGDSFAIDVTWPGPGVYSLFVDFSPVGGTPQLLQTTIVTRDYRGNVLPEPTAIVADAETPKRDVDAIVTVAPAGLAAGREQTLTFTITDARTNAAVTDLEPFLGAAGHLLIASADLADGVHAHPTETRPSGSTLAFRATFPRPGLYRMWVQFQRAGRVVTVPFTVEVPGRR